LKIVLCDDDVFFVQKMDEKIRNYLDGRNISNHIEQYHSGEELLRADISDADVVFLDIQMAALNGIETAGILRQRNRRFALVFLSSWMEYAPEGYAVQATRYVLKDKIDSLFEETMEAVFRELRIFQTPIMFPFMSGEKVIFSDSISYVSSDRHIVNFHFADVHKPQYLYDTLDKIQKMLPENEFIRIHKSYLVNMKYLLDVKNYQASFMNGVILPISQKKFAEIKKRWLRYRGSV